MQLFDAILLKAISWNWFVGVVINERLLDLINSNNYFNDLPQFISQHGEIC
jgi:hypothetical protein